MRRWFILAVALALIVPSSSKAQVFIGGGAGGSSGGSSTGPVYFAGTSDSTPTTITTWDTRHTVLGAASQSNTALGLGFSRDANTIYLSGAEPGVSWRNIRMQGNDLALYAFDGTTAPVLVATFDSSTPASGAVATITNGASTNNIQCLQDNGTNINCTLDGGATWSKMVTKSLTDNTAATFVRIGVASSNRQGGVVRYCADGDNATDFQSRCGTVTFAIVNKAGTETCVVGTPSDTVAVSTGTLTVAFTVDTATPTNGCDLRVTVDSSLNSTVNLSYTLELLGQAATLVTPQ